jgi:probable HAF family extracellular repeat protein
VSRDGRIVVGIARSGCGFEHAFKWEESTGMVDLGSLFEGRASYALDASADGRVVVGYQVLPSGLRAATRWTDGRQELIPGLDATVGHAMATNADGSIVVGQQCRPLLGNLSQTAWIWRAQSGTQCLPAPQSIEVPGPGVGPPVGVEANATSDDGKVVGGGQSVGASLDSNAIIWIDGRGAYLKDFLRANGVPDAFEGWPNTGRIQGISPDGRIVVGYGAAPLGFRAYVVILGPDPVMP